MSVFTLKVGKLLEVLGSKAGAIEGKIRDGSAFSGDPAEVLSQVLIDHGYHYLGKEILYSGVTGAPLEAFIYFGPVYYQRLKHMVMDKVSVEFFILNLIEIEVAGCVISSLSPLFFLYLELE